MKAVTILPKISIDPLSPTGVPVLRTGIYARFSSEGNSPLSADEQIERIRYRLQAGIVLSKLYPHAKIEIDENWVIKDEAKTGRVTREGYELICSGVRTHAFDILLVDDISRATRDLGGTIDLYESLVFNDVEGISISDNITTADPNAKDLFVFKGYANEAQSKNISKNTIRGLELRAIKGYSTGHNPYAYYSEATKTLAMKGLEKPSWFEIKVDYEKAKIVHRIWTEFADGKGCRAIARDLNLNDLPPPYNRQGGATQWSEKVIWNCVNQVKYLGQWFYRQTKVVKNPSTDRLVQKARPENEHIDQKREDLRIISKELELRVSERKLQIQRDREESKGPSFYNKGGPPKHLFVGSMVCKLCKGNMIVVGGKNGGWVGCFNAHRQSSIGCGNRQMIRMDKVESALLSELQRFLDNHEVYKQISKAYNEQMGRLMSDAPQKLEAVEMKIFELKAKVKNYADFIGAGNWSDTIATNLAAAEKSLKALEAERDYLKSKTDDRVFITPAAVKSKMLDLAGLLGLAMPDANTKIRAIFPEKILMEPLREGTKKYYQATGVINLFSISEQNSPFTGRVGSFVPFAVQIK